MKTDNGPIVLFLAFLLILGWAGFYISKPAPIPTSFNCIYDAAVKYCKDQDPDIYYIDFYSSFFVSMKGDTFTVISNARSKTDGIKNWSVEVKYDEDSQTYLFDNFSLTKDQPPAPIKKERHRKTDLQDYDAGISWDRVYVAAASYCKSKLKSPSTADIPFPMPSYVSKVGANTWDVRSTVDAQNGFGVMLRKTWSVTVTYRRSDKHYVFTNLSIR